MRIRVLGCSGAIAKDCRTTSFLIDEDTLIDAGTGVGDLSLDEMRKIEHVFLTHSHLDHVAAIGDDDASIAAGGPVTNLNDAQDVIDCADTLFDVWLAALVGWISGVTPAEQVQRKLERTIRLLLVPSVTLAPHER